MSLSRRNFFLASAGLGVAGGLAYVGFEMSYEEVIVRTLKRTLSDLQLDEDGLRKFAKEFERRYQKGTLKVAAMALSIRFADTPFGKPLRGRLRDFEEFAGELYLMSSNYFLSTPPAAAPVLFVRFYDPWEAPCSNPLAKFA